MKTIAFALLIISTSALAAPPDWLNKVTSSTQVLIVNPKTAPRAEIEALEKKDGVWKTVEVYPAVIGKNGFAEKDQKKEGDKKTPSGIFSFGTSWGYAEKLKWLNPAQEPKIILNPQILKGTDL
jgi:L,D-peptidoglycan transpeptidase YkuD (ErfK/YbiS/YcfS/YnhG family)